MEKLLSKIKPKRQSESLRSFIFKDKIILDFETSECVIFGETNIKSSQIMTQPHKDLYNNTLENSENVNYNFTFPQNLKWHSVIFNSQDSSFFSSISGTGEDIFYLGQINYPKFIIYGLNFKIEYELNFGITILQNILLDYHSFYYLFQMTKHLTGKKTQEIKFAIFDNKLYITNSEYYIIVDQNNNILKFKNSTIGAIDSSYGQNTNTISQVYKKEIGGTLQKTLLRSFGDTVNQSNYQYNTLYTDNEGKIKVWINHKKKS